MVSKTKVKNLQNKIRSKFNQTTSKQIAEDIKKAYKARKQGIEKEYSKPEGINHKEDIPPIMRPLYRRKGWL